jgi:hypothetical protein
VLFERDFQGFAWGSLVVRAREGRDGRAEGGFASVPRNRSGRVEPWVFLVAMLSLASVVLMNKEDSRWVVGGDVEGRESVT